MSKLYISALKCSHYYTIPFTKQHVEGKGDIKNLLEEPGLVCQKKLHALNFTSRFENEKFVNNKDRFPWGPLKRMVYIKNKALI